MVARTVSMIALVLVTLLDVTSAQTLSNPRNAAKCNPAFNMTLATKYVALNDSACANLLYQAFSIETPALCPPAGLGSPVQLCMSKNGYADTWGTLISGCEYMWIANRLGQSESETGIIFIDNSCFPRFDSWSAFNMYLRNVNPAPSPPPGAPAPPTDAIAAPPPKRTPAPCKSIYEVLKATPSLSNLYKAVSMVPVVKKLLSDKNAKYTLIAPNNKAIKVPSSKASKAELAVFLKQHVIKGVYKDKGAWLATANKPVLRLAGGPLTVAVTVADDFKNKIATYIVVLNFNDTSPSVRINFPSNKPNPAIASCKGVVYTSDIAFPLTKTTIKA